MIASVDITGVNYTVDQKTLTYVMHKIAKLDRYIPKHARKSVTADVKLKLANHNHGNKYEVEVILTVPDKILTAKDSTVNMLAAIDIVEAKLVVQLRKYKQVTMPHVGRRRLLVRQRK